MVVLIALVWALLVVTLYYPWNLFVFEAGLVWAIIKLVIAFRRDS